MTNPVAIRAANTADLDTIMEIEREGLNSWSRDSFINELSHHFSHFIVAEKNSVICGFAVAWNVSDGFELNNIAVKREYRNSGVATALLLHLIRLLETKNEKSFFLEVAEKNIPARSFYKKMGFFETGMRKNYYKEDNAIQMKREKNA